MLSVRSLESRYVGTFAGVIWAIVNPLAIILVYWFVFSVGFRVKPSGNIPYIVIFLCGFIPWSLFSETLMTNVQAVSSHANLIKKTVFPSEILPIVNLIASFVTHTVMILILIILLVVNHIPLSFTIFKFTYYFLGMALFSIGLGWFFSALNVFYRDIGQALGVIVNVWFWMTPIAWMMDILPKKWQWVIKLNPLYYVVKGYQSSFIYHEPLRAFGYLDTYFWMICMITVFTGAFFFKKLKPEFADVL